MTTPDRDGRPGGLREDECGSCGESPLNECPKSQRPCGHHCNHVWIHDACDWCGKEFGAEEPALTAKAKAKAWDEGFDACFDVSGDAHKQDVPNPYRADRETPMTVCSNRTDSPGFFTSCWEANGHKACLCGAEVEAEEDVA